MKMWTRWGLTMGLMVCVGVAWAATGREIYSFSGSTQTMAYPHGALIQLANGSLVGTTFGSPLVSVPCNCVGAGEVFMLTPPAAAGGAWTHTTLHAFDYPNGLYAGVIEDATGALYGATYKGGALGKGVIFKLIPPNWNYVVIHQFGGMDGANPRGALVFDQFGRLWGTTQNGGTADKGTIFYVQLGSSSPVYHKTHDFSGGADGQYPYAGLNTAPRGPLGAPGVLFGCTPSGGNATNSGVVFRASDDTFATLFTFSGTDGTGCSDGLIATTSALFGVTFTGGPQSGPLAGSEGTIFELTPTATPPWSHTILHAFSGRDGANPWGSPILATNGDIYGTVYRLTAPNWTFSTEVLTHPPLSNPEGGLTQGGNKVYGTTYHGGASHQGDVFEMP
jgi:hypothetical protein